jgi:hypothetical protein
MRDAMLSASTSGPLSTNQATCFIGIICREWRIALLMMDSYRPEAAIDIYGTAML